MLNIGYLTSNTTDSGDERYTPFYAVTPIVKHLKIAGTKLFGARLTRSGVRM